MVPLRQDPEQEICKEKKLGSGCQSHREEGKMGGTAYGALVIFMGGGDGLGIQYQLCQLCMCTNCQAIYEKNITRMSFMLYVFY